MLSAFKKKGTRMTQIGRIITEKIISVDPQNPCYQRSKKKGTRMTQIGRIITEKIISVDPQNPCYQRSKKRNTNDEDRADNHGENYQ